MTAALHILIWLGIITLGLPIIISAFTVLWILIDGTIEYYTLKKKENETN